MANRLLLLLSLHSVTDHLGLMELFQEIIASLVRPLIQDFGVCFGQPKRAEGEAE